MPEEQEVAPSGYLPIFYRRAVPTSNGATMPTVKEIFRESQDGEEPEERNLAPMARDEEEHITTEQWAFLLNAMRIFDRTTIDRWNHDISVTLMFAGLLSIIIAIFTVNAQHLLQDDPADQSVRLLSQILANLASPQSIPDEPFPADGLDSGFSPSEVAVKINTLWVLSLILSLIVAFFAITIQQWLRRLPVGRQMSVRECIRQRQFRYLGLQAYQVPTIIAFLPVVLQLAVVLFLVGLLYLLQALNQQVLVPFAVVAGVALLVYLVSALLPAFLPRSPYKSLFLPIILAIARAVTVPLVLLVLGLLILATYILAPFFSVVRLVLSYLPGRRWGSYRVVGAIISFRTTLAGWFKRWTSFTISDFTDLEQFWAARERAAMWAPQRTSRLDSAALAWAPHAISQLDLPMASPCFVDLPSHQRTRAALEWAGLHLGNFGWHDLHNYSQYSFVNPAVLPRVTADGGVFALQFRELLLSVLPTDWSTEDHVMRDPAISGILTLLFETVKETGRRDLDDRHTEFLSTLTRLLVTIRDSQVRDEGTELPAVHFATSAVRTPTALLYECCEMGQYTFSRQGALDALRWADLQLSGAAALGTATQSRHIMNVLELVIGASATALLALTQQPSLLSEDDTRPQCRAFLSALSHFLDRNKSGIKLTTSVCAARPAGTVHVVFRDALVSVSRSLINLLENDHIPMGDNCPSGPLYGRILEVCKGDPTFEDAMPYLRQFYDVLLNRRVPEVSLILSTGGTPGHRRVAELNGDADSDKSRGLPEIPTTE